MENTVVRTIRGYELRERIGEGGFGAVHRAYQAVVDREVAVKVILPQYANHPDFIRGFEAEARLIARLEHPFIVPLFDYWREPDGAYLVMRYFQAGSLRRMLKERGSLPPELVAEILAQVSGGLDAAHRHQVIHRDIKPENILMDEEGNAYLADFGIAKSLDSDEEKEPEGFSGTIAYAAPELLNHQPASAQSDIYSLGFVAYEMLMGEHPFANESPLMLVLSHMERELPSIPGVPEAAMLALRRATAKSIEDRYPTARALAKEFQQAIGQQMQEPTSLISFIEIEALLEEIDLVNPYKGLRPFDEADARDFFGRDALLDQLIARLDESQHWHNFLAVVGPSGSGKSSVVHAGLIPALRDGWLPGSDDWFILTMTPGARPLQHLKTALLSIAIDPMDTLSGKLQASDKGLLEALDDVLQIKEDVLLVIDQFEEVFTLVEDEQERQHFLELLYTAVTAPESRLRLIVTLRADFYDKPLLYEHFGALLQARTQVVLPLNSEELEQAITGPARRVGLEVDTDLIAAVISDVRQEPGALPLLQYALTEVFEQREGKHLSLAAYQKSGRVLGALARRAEEVYTSLQPDQQAVAQQIFLRLVAPGEGTEDTRRRARYSELAALRPHPQAPSPSMERGLGVGFLPLLQSVLDAFGKYRLLTFDHDVETREPTIEVAHEALIREWVRLRGWLDQSRSDIRLQRMLASAAADWRGGRRDASYLLGGARLTQFEEWAKTSNVALSSEEQEFLDTSIAEHRRQQEIEAARQAHELDLERRSRRRLQTIVAVLVFASIIGIGLTIFAFYQSQLAQKERDTAQEQTRLAERRLALSDSRGLGMEAQDALREGDTVTALALALQASAIDEPPAEVVDTLIDIAYQPGLREIAFTEGYHQPITALALSPDNRYVLSASGESLWGGEVGTPNTSTPGEANLSPGQNPPQTQPSHALILWDAASGERLQVLREQSAPFQAAAFVPGDSLRAVTASADGAILLWDVLSGEVLEQFRVLPVDRMTFSFSSDGKTMLIVGGTEDPSSGRAFQIVWDVETWLPIRRVPLHQPELWTGRILPGGVTAISTYQSGLQIVWNVTSGQELRRFTVGLPGAGAKRPALGIDVDTTGNNAVFNLGEPDVFLWNPVTGEQLGSFHSETNSTLSASITDDGSQVLVVDRAGELRLWDARSGTLRAAFKRLGAIFETAILSEDGHLAVIGGVDGRIYFWDLARIEPQQIWFVDSRETKQAAFLSGGEQLITMSPTREREQVTTTLTIWDLTTREALRSITTAHLFMSTSMAISPDERLALTGTNPNAPGVLVQPGVHDAIILTDLETGAELWRLETSGEVLGLDFDPLSGLENRPYRAALPQVDEVLLWNLTDFTLERTFAGSGAAIEGIAFSPDGTRIAAISHNMRLTIWETETGELLRQFELGAGSPVVAFSPDGTLIATSGAENTVVLWDVATGAEIRRLSGHEGSVTSFAFSPDGTLALSGGADNIFILWNLTDGTPIKSYDEHGTVIWDVAFSPDQSMFLSAADHLIVWRTAPVTLAETLAWIEANRYVEREEP